MASFMQRFSSKTKIIGKRSTKKYLEEALYRRLFKDGVKENCVGKNLNEFLKSRKSAYKWEVSRSVKLLREKKLYSPAVKLSEKMEKRGMNKTASDQAVHLDLVAKSKGIAAAEAYFTNLSEASKNHFTYSSLLNCYCKELMTEKAEALFEKMKELNLQLTSMPYNSLMTLYSRTGHPEKIPAIIQEMKEGDVLPDCFTYNVWMRALAALGDVFGAERVIDEMKRDGRVAEDWTTYSNLASVYADAGLHDKAENALKELEKKNTTRNLIAYQFLITLYGRIGKLTEVYRVWRTLRLAFPKTANISYLNMIQTLIKLDDLPGAEKCFKEWECGERRMYDIRIANSLIEAYAKQGSLGKAKELKKRAQKGGAKPNAKTWEIFLDYHMKNRETSSAVECIGNAISAAKGDGRRKWVPSAAIVGELMRQYETEKDVDGAERFVVVLKRVHDQLSNEVVELLIRTYAAAGKTSPIMRRRVKMEKAELSGEAMKLLDVICVE